MTATEAKVAATIERQGMNDLEPGGCVTDIINLKKQNLKNSLDITAISNRTDDDHIFVFLVPQWG